MPIPTLSNAGNKAVTLIEPATAETTSADFTIPEGSHATVFTDAAFTTGETVELLIERPDGTFVSVPDGSGWPLVGGTNHGNAVWTKGRFKVKKSATSGSVGVYAFNISFKAREA